MAEKEESGLIGFDPLAWMNEEGAAETSDLSAQVPNEETQQYKAIESADELSQDKKVISDESITEATKDSKIILNATLNIQNVGDLYERLLKQIDSQDTIEIDASAVVSIDTSTLQLLIVLKQTVIKLQKQFIIDFPSDKFIEAAELLGLSEMLEVDQAAAGFF